MIKQFSNLLVVLSLSLTTNISLAQVQLPEPEKFSKGEGMIMLDYEDISVPGSKSIDLMGIHVMTKVNDWLYLGLGAHAPLFKGEYGGFMTLDVIAHAQRKVFGDLFVNAGVSAGGGGGGKNNQHARELSGTGGFVKTYVGLGYDFKDFSVGANFAKMKFSESTINHSQLNAYVQFPFEYSIGSYASSGDRVSSSDEQALWETFSDSGENMVTLGGDNFFQINPEGSSKDTINVADLQFSHFMTKNTYWFVDIGAGYYGLVLYHQVWGGLGYRFNISPQLTLYSQLGLGSGGYAPEKMKTGTGLLVYPKASAEYMLDKNLGVSLSAGYLDAPTGSSKNLTLGAAMNYHLPSGSGSSGSNATDVVFSGYRFNLFQQTEFNVKSKDKDTNNIKMVSLQIDNLINDNIYIPLQVSVAYNAFQNSPGYGEFLGGIGVQNKYYKDSRFQGFGQMLIGTNARGLIVKTGVGMNYGVSDRWAIYGLLGQTIGIDNDKFKSNNVDLGLTYRFSALKF